MIWRGLSVLAFTLGTNMSWSQDCCCGETASADAGRVSFYFIAEATAPDNVSMKLTDVESAELKIDDTTSSAINGTKPFNKEFPKLLLNREYQLDLSGQNNVTDWHVLMDSSEGFTIEVEGVPRRALHLEGDTHSLSVVLRTPTGEFGASNGFNPETRRASFSLGSKQPDGTSVGALSLELVPTLDPTSGEFTADSFDPESLNFFAEASSYVDERGSLATSTRWQVEVAQGLVEVKEDVANTFYEIMFFTTGYSDPGGSALFDTDTAEPIVTYKIDKPATGWETQLDFTETRHQGTPTREAKAQRLTSGSSSWAQTEKGNIRKYSVVVTTDTGSGNPKHTFSTRDANDALLAQTVKIIKEFDWGDEIIQLDRWVEGSGGSEVWLTELTAFDGPGSLGENHISYAMPVSHKFSDGTWVYNHYHNMMGTFATGPAVEVRPWANSSQAAVPTSKPSATTTLEKRYTYTGNFEFSVGDADEYALNNKIGDLNISRTNPTIDSRKYDLTTTTVNPGGNDHAGNPYGNLVSYRAHYPKTGLFAQDRFLAGRIRSLRNPMTPKTSIRTSGEITLWGTMRSPSMRTAITSGLPSSTAMMLCLGWTKSSPRPSTRALET